jgi:hypothetical protein
MPEHTGHAVLPRPKPERHKSQPMATRFLNQAIYEGEVEFAFHRFDRSQ